MRCLIDTNILISAALFPNSVPAQALIKALSPPHCAIICQYSIEEVRRVCRKKFPQKEASFDKFFSMLALSVEIVATPPQASEASAIGEAKIRDVNDRPIYRSAVVANANILLTGDKDLLEAEITSMDICTAATFLHDR